MNARASSMKSVKAPPDVKRLIESLRDLGYEATTAIADLIDNSVAAGATEISVDLHAQEGARPAYVAIADNGSGMDRKRLHESMRFGVTDEHAAEDLGKYGLGLKTASLSQCRQLTVVTKPKPKQGSRSLRSLARWDLDHVYGENDWSLLTPELEELAEWEQEVSAELLPENGTLVLWTQLDEALPLLSSHNVKERERFLARLIADVSSHLRMVFHRFMQGLVPHRRKVRISVCGDVLSPWDPFCRSEDTKELDILKLSVTATKGSLKGMRYPITVAPFVLPAEREFSSQQARDDAGQGNWNQHQGLYFYRNHRLLQAGGWSWLRTPDEHTKLLRVAVDFSGGLDEAFSVNVSKMRARIPEEVRESVRNAITPWAREAKERYSTGGDAPTSSSGNTQSKDTGTGSGSKRPSLKPASNGRPQSASVSVGKVSLYPSNAPSTAITVSKGTQPGAVRLVIPHQHEFASVFKPGVQANELKTLCLTLLGVLEAVVEGKLPPSEVPLTSLRRKARGLI